MAINIQLLRDCCNLYTAQKYKYFTLPTSIQNDYQSFRSESFFLSSDATFSHIFIGRVPQARYLYFNRNIQIPAQAIISSGFVKLKYHLHTCRSSTNFIPYSNLVSQLPPAILKFLLAHYCSLCCTCSLCQKIRSRHLPLTKQFNGLLCEAAFYHEFFSDILFITRYKIQL